MSLLIERKINPRSRRSWSLSPKLAFAGGVGGCEQALIVLLVSAVVLLASLYIGGFR